ncbi:MAG TPA: DUF5686 family protein, partial [Bacteroidales bacterium]|nr:DUF5686 family protein [Bacteroidales bacterium]
MIRKLLFLWLICAGWLAAQGQYSLRGVVTDCRTGDPLAFVNLISADGRLGTSTDIEGRFVLEDVSYPLVLKVTYVGYAGVTRRLEAPERYLRLELCPQVMNLAEVVILPWDNPALAMMRRVVAQRDRHDPARLESYSCDAYGKMVFTADTANAGSSDLNIPDTTMQKIRKLLGEQYLFIMETASERTYTRGRLKEKVTGSRISGLKDPLFVFLISQMQSFTFYDEVIRIADRSYLNPASPAGLRKYYFSLEDTLQQAGDSVFVIRYVPIPGSTADLMRGLLYINGSDWAIQNVTAEPAAGQQGMSISIRQRYAQVSGHWFPVELGTSILLRNVMIGPLYALGDGNYYLRNIRINEGLRKPPGVMSGLEIAPGAHRRDSAFWVQYREGELGIKEQRTYQVIDSIGEAERLDHISRRLDALMRARFPLGPVELDLRRLIRFSEYEGMYAGLGLGTSERRVPWFSLSAYAGYGYGDFSLKYGGELSVPLYRSLDLELRASLAHDLREGGQIWDPRVPGGGMAPNFRRILVGWMDPWDMLSAGIQVRPLRDILLRASWSREELSLEDVPFFFRTDETSTAASSFDLYSLEWRYARGERMLRSPLRIVSLGTDKPVFWLRMRYGEPRTEGVAEPLLSLEFKAFGAWKMPRAGVFNVNLLSGRMWNTQPASWLFNGRGAYRSFTIYTPNAFETAGGTEFLSDRYVYLFLTHDFQHRLTGNRRLPSLRIHANAGWSRRGVQ